ncbi:MAG: hypothetical protein ACKOUM_03460 [Sphingopyxis sp.]
MASRSSAQPAHEWDGIFRSSLVRSGMMIAGGVLGLCAALMLSR